MTSLVAQLTETIKRWTDFGFDATACWSTDPTKRVCYGNHKIVCVRRFPGFVESYDYAMDQVEELQRQSDGKLPTEINYFGTHSHYTWRSASDDRVKLGISKETGASVNQIEIKSEC